MDSSSKEDVESPCQEEIVQVPDSEEMPPSTLTLVDQLGSTFDEEKLSDVTFVVGQDEIPIKAHKLILVSRSPVFSAMLDGPMSEKGDVKIEDSGSIDFKAFLRYLYTDEVNITEECVEAILYLSDKYQVISLRQKCEAFLEEHLRVENACRTFELAHMYSLPNLFNTALDFIGLNSDKCLKSKQFSLLSAEALDLISKSEKLNCNEECVFEALDRWATEKCKKEDIEADVANKKEVLGATLYNVRFPLLHHDYFKNVIHKCKFLSDAEVLAIAMSDESPVNDQLNSNPRRGVTYNTVIRFEVGVVSELEACCVYQSYNAISFTISHSSWLYGVLIYGTQDPKQVPIKLKVNQNTKTVANLEKNMSFTGNELSYNLTLNEPVYIKPELVYTIELTCGTCDDYVASNIVMLRKALDPSDTCSKSNKKVQFKKVRHTKNTADIYPQTSSSTNEREQPCVKTSFRHKTVRFYDYHSKKLRNYSSLYSGQIPGLLLF